MRDLHSQIIVKSQLWECSQWRSSLKAMLIGVEGAASGAREGVSLVDSGVMVEDDMTGFSVISAMNS